MNRIISALVFTGILMSCNSTDKTKPAIEDTSSTESSTESTANTITKQLKPIDTDADLIATAVMAAPEAGRANCKVIG